MIKEADTVEIQVYDNAGNEQGTVLLGIRRLLGEHHGGRLVEAAFLGASDMYYHWWMNNEEDSPSKDRGVYHLCAVACKECPKVKKHAKVVHTDRYRCHGKVILGAKQVPWLKDRTIFDGYMFALGAFDHALAAQAGGGPAPRRVEPEVDWAGDVDPSQEGDIGDQDASSSESSEEDVTMKDRIKELRRQLKQAEDDAAERKSKKGKKRPGGKIVEALKDKGRTERKVRDRDHDRGRKAKPPEPVGEVADQDKRIEKKKKKKRKRRSSSEVRPQGSRGEVSKKQRALVDPAKSGDDSSDLPEELFKVKKLADHRIKEGDHDRGPFGGGAPVNFGDDDDDSTASEGVFRKGLSTSTKSSQKKLLAYTNQYPGRLASRMLLKMEHATARGVEGPDRQRGSRTPAVALNHILTILLPNLGVKAGVRSTRELKTLGTILDHLAMGSPSKAADVVTQRIKAVERASHESHWGSAQFLELLAPENSMLLDKDEEIYVSKEYLLELRLRQYDRGSYRPESGGKGKAKGAKEKAKDKDKGDRGAWDKNEKGGKKAEQK